MTNIVKSPYFKIIITLIIGLGIGLFLPRTKFLANKDISALQHENDSLNNAINMRNKNISKYDSTIKILALKDTFYETEISKRDTYISVLEHQIDSINGLISDEDTIIIKIKKQGYEDINNVNNWNDSQRIIFFSNYFKTHNF